MLIGEMLRSTEGRRPMRFFDEWDSSTDWVGGQLKFPFWMSVSDSCTLSRSWRRRDCLAESISLVGCTCGLPEYISFIDPKEKEKRPTEICSIP